MTRSFAILAALVLAVPVRAADVDLVFPAGEKSARLRIEVVADKAPEVAWAAFLDKLFAYYDRDGDGFLTAAEAKRVFALPGGIVPDFAAMDADRDGQVTSTEFRAFYRAKGFTPVAVSAQSAPLEVRYLGNKFFDHLDRDNDGTLSAAELKQTGALLKRLDEDEDEVLTAAEIWGHFRPAIVSEKKPWPKVVPAAKEPDAVLKLAFGGKHTVAGKAFKFDGARLLVPDGTCTVSVVSDEPASGFRSAKNFYLAQFKAAAGDKPAPKALFEDDPTAQVLAGLFDAADRDGDGKLTRAELEAFFDLIELGVTCRVVVTVTDRGQNLFDLFDTNGDGKLDLDELTRAAKNLPNELARDKPLERDAVPASYHLVAGREPVGESFGPVPFGAAKPKPPEPKAARGPKWFRAMDKNGDGFVSAREFLGPPELFAKLDANGDGRISAEEAEAADLGP